MGVMGTPMLGATLYMEEGGMPGTGGVVNLCMIVIWSNGNVLNYVYESFGIRQE